MENEWLNVSQYDAIRISEYKGRYSIQVGRRGKDDTYTSWVVPTRYSKEAGHSVPVKKRNGDYLNVPFQILLGEEKGLAAEMLKALYFQLTERRLDDVPPADVDVSRVPF